MWDIATRIFHWSLAAAVLVAWLWAGEVGRVHELAGYTVLGLIAFRITWGIAGTRHTLFRDFICGPRVVLGYLTRLLARQSTRYVGHNPAGGWMIGLMLALLTLSCVCGVMQLTRRFFGETWVESVHEWSANLIMLLIPIHICGMLISSWVHRENLVGSMISGSKPIMLGDAARDMGPVERIEHRVHGIEGLALLVLAVGVSFLYGWQTTSGLVRETVIAPAAETRTAPPPTEAPPPNSLPTSLEQPQPPVAGISKNPTWTDVQPLMARHCTSCHAGKDAPLGLKLDTYLHALNGSANGPVFKARDTAGSELMRRIRGESEPRMPLTGPPFLSGDEIGLLERWIMAGLPAGSAADEALILDLPRPGPGETVTFTHVAPILLKRCAKCHKNDGKMGAPPEGLRLDSFAHVVVVVSGLPSCRTIPLSASSSGASKVRRVLACPTTARPGSTTTTSGFFANGSRKEHEMPMGSLRQLPLGGS